jgi:hypothetical protein
LFLAAGLRGDDVKICDLLKKGTDEVLRSLWEFSNRSAAELSLNIDNLRQLTIEQLRGELQGMSGLDRLLARRGVSDAYVFLGTYFTALADMPFVHFGRYVTASLFECIGTVREAYKQTMVKMGIVSADGDHDDEYGDDGSSRRTWTSMTSQAPPSSTRAPSSVRGIDDVARTHVSVRPEDSVSNVVLAQSQARARASEHRAKEDPRHVDGGAFTRGTQHRLSEAEVPAEDDDEPQDQPRAPTRINARTEARDTGRFEARTEARTEARDQVHDRSRDQPRDQVREQARDQVRDQSRDQVRDPSRDQVRDQDDDHSRVPSLARGPRRADAVSDASPDAEHVITHITRQDLQDLHGGRDVGRDGGRAGHREDWNDADGEDVRAPKVPVPSRVQSGQPHGTWHASAAPPSQRPSLAVVRVPNQFDADADGRYAGLAASAVSTLSTHRPTPSDAGSKLFEKLSKLRSVTYDEHGDPRDEEEKEEEVGRGRKNWDS